MSGFLNPTDLKLDQSIELAILSRSRTSPASHSHFNLGTKSGPAQRKKLHFSRFFAFFMVLTIFASISHAGGPLRVLFFDTARRSVAWPGARPCLKGGCARRLGGAHTPNLAVAKKGAKKADHNDGRGP